MNKSQIQHFKENKFIALKYSALI